MPGTTPSGGGGEKASPPPPGLVRTTCAGAFANVTECCAMHPLDSAKTRMQLAGERAAATPAHATTLRGTLSGMWEHGGLRVVYRGLLPAVGMQAPRGMIKFASNATVFSTLTSRPSSSTSAAAAAAAAGFTAGTTESVFITPFEFLKVRLQAADRLGVYRNALHALPRIVRTEGAATFWTGLAATMARNGVWNAGYFGGVHVQREAWRASAAAASAERGKTTESLSSSPPLLVSFCHGTLAGALGSCFSNPLDVYKTRRQNAAAAVPATLLAGIASIYRAEGIRGLYRGYSAKVARLGPGGGVLLVAFEAGGRLYDRLVG